VTNEIVVKYMEYVCLKRELNWSEWFSK